MVAPTGSARARLMQWPPGPDLDARVATRRGGVPIPRPSPQGSGRPCAGLDSREVGRRLSSPKKRGCHPITSRGWSAASSVRHSSWPCASAKPSASTSERCSGTPRPRPDLLGAGRLGDDCSLRCDFAASQAQWRRARAAFALRTAVTRSVGSKGLCKTPTAPRRLATVWIDFVGHDGHHHHG